MISNELILKWQGIVRTWELTSSRFVTHGYSSIRQHRKITAPHWLSKAGLIFPLHLWMNARKKIKSKVMRWNCPWNAVGVMVTLHTINGRNEGKCKNAKGCVTHEDIQWLICWLVLPFPKGRTWQEPLRVGCARAYIPSFLSLELKL